MEKGVWVVKNSTEEYVVKFFMVLVVYGRIMRK